MHIPSTIGAEEAEEIGVEHLLRDIKDLDTGTLSSRVAEQLSSLRGLQSRLAEIREYLQQVVKGELPVNHQIIGNLQDVFNLLPHLETPLSGPSDEATRTSAGVTITTNDQLLVLYLSSLIRAVIALHDLVNNKVRPRMSLVSALTVPSQLELSAASDAVRSAPATAEEATSAKKKEEDGKASEAKEQDKRGL
jgi:26S proteasome regulatory subunit N8